MKNNFFEDDDFKKKKESFDVFLKSVYSTKSKDWSKVQEKNLLSIFRNTVRVVPAYKEFCKKKSVDYTKITSVKSISCIPSVSKKNYLRAFPWQTLCKDGSLAKESLVMTSTSGSTGEPFYFPRTPVIDVQSSVYHQMFLANCGITKNRSTLVIDCFGMGVWIGGLITYQAFKYIGERGYPITVITPGINKREVFQALRNIGDKFDSIILCGYPPFIKDIIDDGKENNITWSKYSLKIIFAAESFSETFRDYIVKEAGIQNVYRDTMNIYGSADLGTMAEETPLSILLRRISLTNKKFYKKLFGQASRLPTLAQYIPPFVTFESNKGSVYCTGDNVLPLVRYEIGDNGGVLTYDEVETICREEGIDLVAEIKKAKIGDTITQLPFVYIYERSDFSASFYGALIYPEYIKKALAHDSLYPYITGKFTMYTKNDEHENQYLEINIEMKQNQKIEPSMRAQIVTLIQETLMEQSAEYKKITESLGKKALPKLTFWSYGHEKYFFGGAKQKWVKKGDE